MKPSPMLEDTAKLKEYCAWILRSASETAPASCVARAYLALISAQPGVNRRIKATCAGGPGQIWDFGGVRWISERRKTAGVSPGGEGVTPTRDQIARILWDREFPISDEQWAALPDETEYKYGEYPTGKGDYLRDADAILALFRPTSPDPARATEEWEGK